MSLGMPLGWVGAQGPTKGVELFAAVSAVLQVIVDERQYCAGVPASQCQLGEAPNALKTLLTTDLVDVRGDDLAHDPLDQIDVHILGQPFPFPADLTPVSEFPEGIRKDLDVSDGLFLPIQATWQELRAKQKCDKIA